MTTLREAATQALEALEGGADSWQLVGPAIDVLRAALAEPEYPLGRATTDVGVPVYVLKKAEPVQEPVAYSVGRTLHWHEGKGVNDAQLYLAPPQRKPLTEEAITQCFADAGAVVKGQLWVKVAREIERAHGIT